MTIAATACPLCATASKFNTYAVTRAFNAPLYPGGTEAPRKQWYAGEVVNGATFTPSVLAALLDGSWSDGAQAHPASPYLTQV